MERGEEFEDVPEDEGHRPPLPPEDRLWRHPSELAFQRDADSEVAAARDRWLASTPTRAGAWSAGLVGAVLAAGVVLLGTHLSGWIDSRPAASHAATSLTVMTTLPHTMFSSRIDTEVTPTAVSSVAAGLALVSGESSARTRTGDGVVLQADGMIVVPLWVIQGATDVQVVTSDHEQFDATVVGTDGATGLALVHADVNGLTPARFAAQSTPSAGTWAAFEWTAPLTTVFSVTPVQSAVAGARLGDGPGLLVSVVADPAGLPSDPIGAVMVDPYLAVAGMVDARNGSTFVEVPPDVLVRVGDELATFHRMMHGWLGISGISADPVIAPHKIVAGVKITAVDGSSAAARVGLHPGDVILAVNGQRVRTMAQIQRLLYFDRPNQAVEVRVERGGAAWTCWPRLGTAA